MAQIMIYVKFMCLIFCGVVPRTWSGFLTGKAFVKPSATWSLLEMNLISKFLLAPLSLSGKEMINPNM
jgi:hypothetical protein